MWRSFFRAGIATATLLVAACGGGTTADDAALHELVASIGRNEINRSPEQASNLGVAPDTFGGKFDGQLDDRSIAASQRLRTNHLDALAALERIDPDRLTVDGRRLRDTLLFTYQAAAMVDRHGYGYVNLGWASPYLINHSDGAYTDIVKLLMSHHPVRSLGDAESWLARLRLAGSAVRDEQRRFEIDLSAGATPPKRILQRTLARIDALQAGDPREHMLTMSFAESLSQISDIPEAEISRMIAEAASIISADLKPAYGALASTVRTAIASASEDPGVWRLPNGDAYYRDALKLYTTTDFSPDDIHAIGLALVEQTTEQMNTLLTAMEMTEGSVGARMAMLRDDPVHHYEGEDGGEAALIADINTRMTWAATRLSRLVSVGPSGPVELRRAPVHAQTTSPLAYYRSMSLDGERPATYTLNLTAASDLPRWSVPTLTFHEALPGHHLQAGLTRENSDFPLLMHLVASPALAEGWAVYGEDLAAELGAYQDDPLGMLGYLQALQFRAARLVADTGLHNKKWTHQQTVDYLVDVTGLPRASMENEVDRYTIWPGHACTYMIGREKIRNLRENADIELGPDFDLIAFHDTVLGGGGRPLHIVERDVQDWIMGVKAKRAAAIAEANR